MTGEILRHTSPGRELVEPRFIPPGVTYPRTFAIGCQIGTEAFIPGPKREELDLAVQLFCVLEGQSLRRPALHDRLDSIFFEVILGAASRLGIRVRAHDDLVQVVAGLFGHKNRKVLQPQ
jgi:hypothetical protein